MTAATWRPSTPDLYLSDRDAGDRLFMRVGLLVAALLHVAFLAIPVIKPEPLIVQPDRKVIELNPIDIPPPPMPDRVEPTRTRLDYLESVPVPLPEPPEPIRSEPAPVDVDVTLEDLPGDYDDLSAVTPPAPPRDIYEEGDLELIPPLPIEPKEQPRYPEMARKVRQQGRVVLQAVIDEQGRVTEIEVLRGVTPDLGIDAEAVRAVSLWRYQPGTVRGRPVKVRMRVLVDFSLQ